MIRLDRSERTVLAICQCGWRHLDMTDVQAWQASLAHTRACHTVQAAEQCRKNRDNATRRRS